MRSQEVERDEQGFEQSHHWIFKRSNEHLRRRMTMIAIINMICILQPLAYTSFPPDKTWKECSFLFLLFHSVTSGLFLSRSLVSWLRKRDWQPQKPLPSVSPLNPVLFLTTFYQLLHQNQHEDQEVYQETEKEENDRRISHVLFVKEKESQRQGNLHVSCIANDS